MKNLENKLQKIQLGTVDNESIFLSPPSWDCGWYWGFGYLDNKNCHYHLSELSKDYNLFDGIKNILEILLLSKMITIFGLLQN